MKKTDTNPVVDCIKSFNENRGHPIKIFLSFFTGQVFTVINSIFFSVIRCLPAWINPIITANIINIATSPQDNKFSAILINAAVLAVCLVGNIFGYYQSTRIYNRFIRQVEYKLRSSLIQKLQQLSIAYHKNTSSGKLQSKIMRDCENIEVILAYFKDSLFEVLVSIIIAVTVTLRKSPEVMLFFLVLVPFELILIKVLRKNIRARNTNFRNEMEITQSNVSEVIDLIPVTRAHGLQNTEVHKMDRRFGTLMNSGYKLDKMNALFGSSTWVLMQLSQLACLVFTSYLSFVGKITVGEVVLYQTYFGQIVGQINSLINYYPQLTKGLESVNSISEILCEDNVEPNSSIIPLPNMTGKVDFRDVCYRYDNGKDWVLNNFNLSVKDGESIAFVGGSGAGKSTVLNLLIGFDRPQEGKILIDGINMQNLDINEFRRQIAVVPQDTILFAGSIRDNITYGTENVTDEKTWKILRDVGLDDIIQNMPDGLSTHLGEHGGKLSGGQRQRISIARALLRNPKIIIFDEATSALDSVSEKKVQNAVDNMMKHCTTFLVAHRLSTIKNADRVAVLEHGKIIEIGTYDELMDKKGAFYNLKKLQE